MIRQKAFYRGGVGLGRNFLMHTDIIGLGDKYIQWLRMWFSRMHACSALAASTFTPLR